MGGPTQGQLLPPSLPFRFFGGALVFHIAGWVLILFAAESIPGFSGGPGLTLAALHAMTLGVVAMTAIGAALQLLPVATGRPLAPVLACETVFWLFAPGSVALVAGFASDRVAWMMAGGGLAAAGLALFAVLVARSVWGLAGTKLLSRPVFAAMLAAVVMAGLGWTLTLDFNGGFLGDHRAFALTHAIVAVFGFMGLLVLGFTSVLVPMLALAPAMAEKTGRLAGGLGIAGVAMAGAGALGGWDKAVAIGAMLGLAAAGMHLRAIALSLRKRMRRRWGIEFGLMGLAWAALPAALLVGLALAVGWGFAQAPALFGFLAVFGWLLSFLLGILQRVMPFLTSMHLAQSGVPPLLSDLTADMPLKAHLCCHVLAIVAIAGGIAGDGPWLVRLGGALGLAGALAFAIFALLLARRASRC